VRTAIRGLALADTLDSKRADCDQTPASADLADRAERATWSEERLAAGM